MPGNFAPPTAQELLRFAPESLLILAATIFMVLEPLSKEDGKRKFAVLSFLTLAAAIVLAVVAGMDPGPAFSNLLVVDSFSTFFTILVLAIGLFTVLLSSNYLQLEGHESGEYYSLLLFSIVGQCLMAASNDLIMLFIGLECSSIASYVLAGYLRDDRRNNESALKYFLLGSFATAFFLYGIAVVYGATGSTYLAKIADAEPTGNLLRLGLTLILIGLGFKIAAAPFQIWTPDVYEGAPTPVTALFSAGPKAATFALLLRIFGTSQAATDFWFWAFWILAALTMFAGNLGALVQGNVKRMLAYSSIAHAGYTLVAFAAVTTMKATPLGPGQAYGAVAFYLASYALVSVGAFTILSELGGKGERYLTQDDYAGLGTRQPFAAAMLSLFLLSFLGLPITAGFFGKLYIFTAAINSKLIWLAILMAINSVIGAYYYLRLIVVMYMYEYKGTVPAEAAVGLSPTAAMVVTVAGLITVYLGIMPNHVLGLLVTQNPMVTSR